MTVPRPEGWKASMEGWVGKTRPWKGTRTYVVLTLGGDRRYKDIMH